MDNKRKEDLLSRHEFFKCNAKAMAVSVYTSDYANLYYKIESEMFGGNFLVHYLNMKSLHVLVLLTVLLYIM